MGFAQQNNSYYATNGTFFYSLNHKNLYNFPKICFQLNVPVKKYIIAEINSFKKFF